MPFLKQLLKEKRNTKKLSTQNQKFGDLQTAISPAPTQKATSSSSGQLPSKSLEQSSVDNTAKVDSSSPKEVEVDGKKKNVFRKEAEAYANELDEDDEIVDGLDLPDDMPEEIALSEALNEAREEVNTSGAKKSALQRLHVRLHVHFSHLFVHLV